MSQRTLARRRREQGLSRPAFYPFNEEFFHTWSDDLAWLLGLIWSDGCLKGDSVEIVSKDRDLIEAIVTLIGQEEGVKKRKDAEAWYVCFTSQEVADWLRSLGLTVAKSFSATFPALPPAYEAAFVRGLIDGDGSVDLSSRRPGQQVADLRVRLVGASPAMRDGFSRWLAQYGIPYTASHSHDRVWQVTVTKQESLRVLYRLLYPTPEVSALARKRRPFDLWMATPRARPGRRWPRDAS
ncbi:MAG: LAGLIDADG family homing endonuclease [Ktedonobacteraceae bacterium]|jgi:hypothetical protein